MRMRRFLPLSVMLGATLLLAYAILYRLDLFATTGLPAEPTSLLIERSELPTPKSSRPSASDIAKWHLFGKKETETKSAPKSTPPPATRLQLTLRGVFFSSKQDLSRAIIASPKGKERQYKVGDELPGGAILHKIEPQGIILRRNKRYESLTLSKVKDVAQSGNPGDVDPNRTATD